MTSDKKVIEIHGVLQKPLEIGSSAFILEDNGIRRTSTVLEYKQVSENDDDPVWTAVLRTRKHKYNFHHGCVADCKSADTHEGECIGKVAQDNLKQFKDTLYDKHAFFFWHNLGFFLCQVCKRLFEENKKQR